MSIDTQPEDKEIFKKTVRIHAFASQIWRMLTVPNLMEKWMMPDIDLQILTDWKVGGPIRIQGTMNGKKFENRGMVLQFEPEKSLKYSHLSSISRLPDQPESYSIIGFELQPSTDLTFLTVTVSNFPTVSIYKHLSYYWSITPEVIRRLAEEQG